MSDRRKGNGLSVRCKNATQGRLQRAGVVKGVPKRMKGGTIAGINQRTGTQGRSEGGKGSSESESAAKKV